MRTIRKGSSGRDVVVLSEVIGSYGSELKATVGFGMSGSFPGDVAAVVMDVGA